MAREQGWRPRIAVALALLLASSAVAGISDRARRLAELRAEVEQLAETADLEKETLRADLRSLERETAELEAKVRQAQARLNETERQLQRRREAVSAGPLAHEALDPVLLSALDALEDAVRGSLPYRSGDRLQAIADLRDQVQGGEVDPRRAAGRVWTLVEDEQRLARENALDRQVIPIDGEELLVDVGRIGMVALYWRAPDGRAGQALPRGGDWQWTAFEEADAAQVLELFDALEKQVRVGDFELPGLLDGVEVPR